MVDLALDLALTVADDIAVNVHSSDPLLLEHLTDRVHISLEAEERLGTAGGVARLREWIAERDIIVINCDSFVRGSIDTTVDSWTRDRVTVMVTPDHRAPDFEKLWRAIGISLIPNDYLGRLKESPSGLYEALWKPCLVEGSLDLVPFPGLAIDCGTLPDYLAANLVAAQNRVVLGTNVMCLGEVIDSVVWDGCTVASGEHLVRSIRASDTVTVCVG